MTDSATQTRFRIDGMDCAACASKITNAVRRVPGVDDVSVSVTAGTMTVRHAESAILEPAILRQVNGLGGYTATRADAKAKPGNDNHGHDHGTHEGHDHAHDHAGHSHAASAGSHGHGHGPSTGGAWYRSRKGQLTIASGVGFAVAYAVGKAYPPVAGYAFIAAMLIGLVPIARRAVMAAFAGSPFTIEMLMMIAAVGAVVIGATEEAAAVVFLFLVGELLEGVAASKARASIQGLTALVPKTALIEENGRTREVPADNVKVGSTILVRPGDRIAADGEIVEGESAVDEAPVTGESVPKRKGKGDAVFAGTINADGVLRVKVTAAASDNTIARIVRLVEEAQESKAPTERFIDRFSTYYTPAVVVVAALVAVIPPLARGPVLGGMGLQGARHPADRLPLRPGDLDAGRHRGVAVGRRPARAADQGRRDPGAVGTITAIAMDKTGTLTEGKPKVTDVVAVGRSERDVLSMAAALETGSSHPLAVAILAKAKAEAVPVPPAADASAIAGKGIVGRVGGRDLFLGSPAAAAERGTIPADQATRIAAFNDEGKSVSVLMAGADLAGIFAIRDEPRADAKAGIDALKAMGITPVMLTGDNRRTAEAIGKGLGIEVRAELLPQDKQRIIREIQAAGKKVAKVGDGINDAPALAAADVGIAMGGGTDVALETADAAVLHGRVLDLARMVGLSRRTMGNIRQNITVALGLKAVFLVTTIAGITGLWPAILADTGATVLVTANAMRLLRLKEI